jgi:hypothetical protein
MQVMLHFLKVMISWQTVIVVSLSCLATYLCLRFDVTLDRNRDCFSHRFLHQRRLSAAGGSLRLLRFPEGKRRVTLLCTPGLDY